MTQDKRRQRGFSRRKFMQTAAAGAAAAASGTMLGGAAQAHGKKKKPNLDPDVILQNGRIHTMDAHGTVASSVVIKDGRFMRGRARALAHATPAARRASSTCAAAPWCPASSTTTTTWC